MSLKESIIEKLMETGVTIELTQEELTQMAEDWANTYHKKSWREMVGLYREGFFDGKIEKVQIENYLYLMGD